MVRADRIGLGLVLLGATLVLGTAFLAIKGIEYGRHIDEGLLPGRLYASTSLTGRGAVIFYTLYWFATGLHAVHVTVGLVVLGWLALRVALGRIGAEDPVALEAGAMYWHLVDIVWLVLWPLLYLAR
jgi:cytochrome c oxidase subunit 3